MASTSLPAAPWPIYCTWALCVCLSWVVCLYVRLLVLYVIECAGLFCSRPTTVEFEFQKVTCWERYVINNLEGFCWHGHPGPEMPCPTCGAPFIGRSVSGKGKLVCWSWLPEDTGHCRHCRLCSPTRGSAIISRRVTVQDSLLGPRPLIRIPSYCPTWRNFCQRKIREAHLSILNRPDFALRWKHFVDPDFPKEAWLILLT